MQNSQKVVATNKKAYHDYFIEDTYEAGIALTGCEVKSVRQGNINLKDSYAMIKDGEILLVGVHISPYQMGSYYNSDPRRIRRLLLHKVEIRKLSAKVYEKGYTLVVTKVYFKQGLVKVELAVAKGKDGRDKRRDIQERDMKREIQRTIKENY